MPRFSAKMAHCQSADTAHPAPPKAAFYETLTKIRMLGLHGKTINDLQSGTVWLTNSPTRPATRLPPKRSANPSSASPIPVVTAAQVPNG
jgi:hypothetical protein